MFWSFSEAWNVNFQVECDCVFFGGILHKATALVWGLLTPPNNGYAFKRRFSVTAFHTESCCAYNTRKGKSLLTVVSRQRCATKNSLFLRGRSRRVT